MTRNPADRTVRATNRPELLQQIREASRRYGAKTQLALALGYTRGTIHEKLKRDDAFTDDELERAAGVLVVHEANRLIEELQEAEQAAQLFDEKLLASLIGALEEVLDELGRKLAPAKKAELIAKVYRRELLARAAGEPGVSGAEIIRLVRDAA